MNLKFIELLMDQLIAIIKLNILEEFQIDKNNFRARVIRESNKGTSREENPL